MDTNNWRPAQAEQAMDLGDWRTQLSPDSRQGAVNRIMDTLKRHLPVSGQEGLRELRKIAVRFEEKIYTAATSQKISLKILTMETKNSAGNSQNPPDPAEYNKLTTTQCQFGFRTRKCADFIAAEH
eukprot:XP_010645564.1 PREDICTED: mediator of RNA polymerase II transcription subunit 15a isoform X6 [Vitis vinifera]